MITPFIVQHQKKKKKKKKKTPLAQSAPGSQKSFKRFTHLWVPESAKGPKILICHSKHSWLEVPLVPRKALKGLRNLWVPEMLINKKKKKEQHRGPQVTLDHHT